MSARGSSRMDLCSFYSGRSVLVTGASGFLGKVLVEKLLRSLPGVTNVFLLIRPQNGHDAKQRLLKILDSKIFNKIRDTCPDRFDKLVPISGNLMEHNLAINDEDRETLCRHVSVVFHCAATVKFDEALRISVEMNVIGTQRLMSLSEQMSNLVAFVHASTAYANCDRTRIVENVYPPPIQPQKLIDALEWMSDDMVDSMTPHIVGRRPNTYTLTKSLAEFILVHDQKNLPISIVRPSIIGATWREPLPGWTDNLNGPTGLFVAVAKGVLTNMCGNVTAKADIVPVDIVSNLLIATAWHRANNQPDHIPVINCCSGRLNPVRWGYIVRYLEVLYRRVPVDNAFRFPSTAFHNNRHAFEIHLALKHIVPAYIIDAFCRLVGKKPRMVKMYSKLLNVVETLHYFTTHEWDFQSKAILEIYEQMTEHDQQEFCFDIRQMNWAHYLHTYMLGCKKYILNDDFTQLPQAQMHLNRLKWLSVTINLASIAICIQFLFRRWSRQRRWLVFAAAAFAQTYATLKTPDLPLAVSDDELERSIAEWAQD